MKKKNQPKASVFKKKKHGLKLKLYSSVVVLKTKYVILLTVKSTVIYYSTTAVIKGQLSTGEEEHDVKLEPLYTSLMKYGGTDAPQKPFSGQVWWCLRGRERQVDL